MDDNFTDNSNQWARVGNHAWQLNQSKCKKTNKKNNLKPQSLGVNHE
jgi:hypothetical protein